MSSEKEDILKRVTVDPDVLVGKPVIRGTRLSVELVLGLLANGMSMEELLEEYPSISRQDILACLHFASRALGDSSFVGLDSDVA